MTRTARWPRPRLVGLPALFVGILFVVAGSSPSRAQGERTNVRGLGMARTFVVASRGIDAVGVNPANLAYSLGKSVSFTIVPTVGFHTGSTFLDYDLYTSYFTGVESDSGRVGKYLTGADKERVLDDFHGDVGRIFSDVEVRLFALGVETSIGTFAFTVLEHQNGFADIPRDYVEFLFNGNPPGSVYDFSDTDVKAAWTREYVLSFGRPLKRLTFTKTLEAGVSLKLIHGFAYFGTDRFNSSLVTSTHGELTGTLGFSAKRAMADFLKNDAGGGYVPFPAPAGVGYAVDLGASAMITDFVSVGISLTDVGSMRWTRNAVEQSIDTSFVLDDASQFDPLRDALKGKGEIKDVNEFYSTLPTQLRLGVALQIDKWPGNTDFPGSLLVELDYNQGFKNTPGSTTTPRFSLGVEYLPVQWLPLRTGISAGGTDGFNLAFGFGVNLGAWVFDLSTENVTWLFAPTSFSYASLALGMQFRF
jgi:hypothetical protein